MQQRLPFFVARLAALAARAPAALAALLLLACSPPFDWREVRSTDGGFVVVLPGRPQTATREVDYNGRKLAMTMTSAGVGPTMFAVGVAQLPAGLATDGGEREAALTWFRDGLIKNIGGTLSIAQSAHLSAAAAAGHTVRAGQAVAAKGKIGAQGRAAQLAARFYVVDDRLYQLVAIGAEGELPAEILDTFFASFRLT
jgi:hypothetical protein